MQPTSGDHIIWSTEFWMNNLSFGVGAACLCQLGYPPMNGGWERIRTFTGTDNPISLELHEESVIRDDYITDNPDLQIHSTGDLSERNAITVLIFQSRSGSPHKSPSGLLRKSRSQPEGVHMISQRVQPLAGGLR